MALRAVANSGSSGSGPGGVISSTQILTTGTAYTTGVGARQIRIRMIAGGGAGGPPSGGSIGTSGGTTSFNSVTVIGGSPGNVGTAGGANGGAGGSGGTGSPTAIFRSNGQNGAGSATVSAGVMGGSSPLGFTYGAGGFGAGSGTLAGAGGGAGEYAEFIINSPAASYTYAIGAGGTVTGAQNGFPGVIIVDEFY